jgi:hypothetical protein
MLLGLNNSVLDRTSLNNYLDDIPHILLVPTAFALERKAKDRTNINAFAKLETQQC